MKFNCGPTEEEKIEAKEKWHKWFAWYPIRVGSGDCRWLETLNRKGKHVAGYDGGYWIYEYQPLGITDEQQKSKV